MTYTPEQIAVAREYETKAWSVIHDGGKFDAVMAEFEQVKRGWSAREKVK